MDAIPEEITTAIPEEISVDRMQGYVDTAVEMAMQYGPKLILAILVLIIGLWIINRVIRLMGAAMERSNTEPTLAKFLCNLSSVGLTTREAFPLHDPGFVAGLAGAKLADRLRDLVFKV